MGVVDIARQQPNVFVMKQYGAKVIPVTNGSGTLKDAVNEALRYYLTNVENCYYLIGSVVGPYPFPKIVQHFQKIIGEETREQILEKENILPTEIIACVGGGSNAMGIFSGYLDNESVKLHGVEPAGISSKIGDHASSISYGKPGTIHGFKCYLLQDENGEPAPVHSVASGLDYPGVGPEHSMLHDIKRVQYGVANDVEAIDAFYELSRLEGIIPALESAHAVAYGLKLAKENPYKSILINLSGRGDKDLDYVVDTYGLPEDKK
jgi:tryptophan synthase beta chain